MALFQPLVSIVHRSLEGFQATFGNDTEMVYICSSWSSYLSSSMWRGPQEDISYDPVLSSTAVPCMSASSNFDRFCDESQMAVDLLFSGMLPQVLQYSLLYYCAIAVKRFLRTFSSDPRDTSIVQYHTTAVLSYWLGLNSILPRIHR